MALRVSRKKVKKEKTEINSYIYTNNICIYTGVKFQLVKL